MVQLENGQWWSMDRLVKEGRAENGLPAPSHLAEDVVDGVTSTTTQRKVRLAPYWHKDYVK